MVAVSYDRWSLTRGSKWKLLVFLACVAGRRKGVRKVKMSAGSEGKGTACKDAIVFFVFYVHKMNVKILIGQI